MIDIGNARPLNELRSVQMPHSSQFQMTIWPIGCGSLSTAHDAEKSREPADGVHRQRSCFFAAHPVAVLLNRVVV
jgi:hypothetical protein